MTRLQPLLDSLSDLINLEKLWDDVRSSLWFIPTAWMLALGAAAVSLNTLDRVLHGRGLYEPLPLIFKSEPDQMRDMLTVIASSMLTVVSLAFSLTMIAVVQTANAYSPQILREYLRDRYNQHVLGIFVGTFVYAILVLRNTSASQESFTPVLGHNGALLLAIVATLALIAFIDHVTRSIKVNNIIHRLVNTVTDTLDADAEVGQPSPDFPGADPDAARATLRSGSNGYIRLINGERALALAEEHDLIVRFHARVGDYIIRGGALAEVEGEASDEARDALRATLVLSSERSMVQDHRHGLGHLVDIALRALSPGINDPTTAIDALHAITTLLGRIARTHTRRSEHRADAGGAPRLELPGTDFRGYLAETLHPILHYGGSDPRVAVELVEAIARLGEVVPHAEERDALRDTLRQVQEGAAQHHYTAYEQQRFTERLAQVDLQLTG